MNYACPSWNMDRHFKFDSVLHNKITHSTRENFTVDNWADSTPLIKAFTLNNAKTNYGSFFEAEFRVNDAQHGPADRNYRNWKTQKNTLFAATQSILSLHFAVHDSTFTTGTTAHSRAMMAVTRALCLATGGPQPSVQSASYNLKHNNYRAVAPAYLIIKASGNVPWACSLQKKIPKPSLRGSELYN